jgi:RNA-directed DNA polymerase
MPKDAPPNGGAGCAGPKGPWQRVSEMQDKLHRWAVADNGRRLDDVFNLVHDPATLIVAFDRVAGNRGRNTPGVDGVTAADIEQGLGMPGFLDQLRTSLKDGSFRPVPVRQRKIPKPGGSGKLRKLGIPTIADRVVQAALKLVLEPIFEADFLPVSYGFRPRRRAHDAIAEIQMFGSRGYQWVLDADIEACFDRIDHSALMGRVRLRVKDKRVLALVKAFLKAGVLIETGRYEDSDTGTPQGGIITPPTQWATSASTSRWITGGWNGRGVSRTGRDMSGSIFMAWLVVVVVLMPASTPSGSTRLPSCWPLVLGSPRPRISLPSGSAARRGRGGAMPSAPPRVGQWWLRSGRRCSPSSCPWRWWRESASRPRYPGARSPPW